MILPIVKKNYVTAWWFIKFGTPAPLIVSSIFTACHTKKIYLVE